MACVVRRVNRSPREKEEGTPTRVDFQHEDFLLLRERETSYFDVGYCWLMWIRNGVMS